VEDVMEVVADATAKVIELYQSGQGTRLISEATQIPRTTIRRILQRSGLYVGKGRVQQPVKAPAESLSTALALPVAADQKEDILAPWSLPGDLSSWQCEEAKCRRLAAGTFLLELSGIFGKVWCPVSSDVIGKTITWTARLAVLSRPIGCIELGIGDNSGSETVHAVLQLDLANLGSVWCVTKAISGQRPVLWLRSGQHGGQVLRINNVVMEVQ
jgi:hypothetical protein